MQRLGGLVVPVDGLAEARDLGLQALDLGGVDRYRTAEEAHAWATVPPIRLARRVTRTL